MPASPSSTRIGAVKPGGYIEPSGLADLKDTLGRPGVVSAFHTWKTQRMTQLVAGAIRDLIVNQPLGIADEDRLVQYGITQGLEMAYQLVSDPSVLLPGVFGQGTSPGAPAASVPDENFDTPADGAS